MPQSAAPDVPIGGDCEPRFAAVRAAFEANFAEHGEVGAACTVVVGGRRVVDLWGGWADSARTRPWTADTLVNVYSVGKGVVSFLLLQLIDAGQVDLDAPVADYWPEFVAEGKHEATVRHALCHRAGVPAIREALTNDDLWDFDRMCDALAATAPWWPPGERHSYHTNTFGHLIGGIIRRVTGRTPGTALRDLAADLHADVHFGLVSDDDLARCAELVSPAARADASAVARPPIDQLPADQQMTLLSYSNPPGYSSSGVVNTDPWRRAEVPATNGHMTARGIAGFYDAVLNGRVLSESLLAEAALPQSTGPCPTLGTDVTFGLGLQPWTAKRQIGRSPGAFGHFGSGGALGFADPSADLAFGYAMNAMLPGWQNPRNRGLVDAVYASLAT